MVAVAETATRKVTSRGRGQFERGYRGGLGPIELRDAINGDAPALEMSADTEWDDEARLRLGCAERQRAHDSAVEVIVVIVRSDDRVERRKIVERQGRLVKPLGTDQGGWRRAARPHRIEEDTRAINLDQHRRMSQPRRAESRHGWLGEARFRESHDRQRTWWNALFVPA